MEAQHMGEAAVLGAGLQDADGRRAVVDLGIALVGHQQKIVAPGQRHGAAPIGQIGHRALGIGGRAEIEDGRPLQQRRRQGLEIRQEAGRRRAGEIDGFGTGRHGAGLVGLIEGVGEQRQRHAPRLAARHRRQRHHEQALARALQRQDGAVGVDQARRQPVAAREPGGHGAAQAGRALDRRIDAIALEAGGQRAAAELRHAVARLADPQGDGLAPAAGGLDAGDQVRHALERVLPQPVQPVVDHAASESAAASMARRRGAMQEIAYPSVDYGRSLDSFLKWPPGLAAAAGRC